MNAEHVQINQAVRQCAVEISQHGVNALGDLYDITAKRMVRYAFTLTRHLDDAEDALQAALLRVARRPKLLARAHNPWAYFLRIVRNEALRLMKRRPMGAIDDAPDVASLPEWLVDRDEIRRQVRQSLDKLPTPQSEVVVLKIWEQMTFAEIAEVLGESPNTVASRYRYALEKLTSMLREIAEEPQRRLS